MSELWEISKPSNHLPVKDLATEMRSLKLGLTDVLYKEHNVDGTHIDGAFRVYLKDSSYPVVAPSGDAINTAATSNDGRLYVNSSTLNLFVYAKTSAGVVAGWVCPTPNYVLAQTEFNANSFVVDNLSTGDELTDAINIGQVDTTYLSSTSLASGLITLKSTTECSDNSLLIADSGYLSYKLSLAGLATSIGTSESQIFQNGLIKKNGYLAVTHGNSDGPYTVSFATSFPNSCLSATARVLIKDLERAHGAVRSGLMTDKMIVVMPGADAIKGFYWEALGY